jgi:transcriptional regulator with XRE-family HTH domain
MTQEALAMRSGVDRTTISQVERGKASPTVSTLIRLAGGLDVAPSALIPSVRWHPASPAPSPSGEFRAAQSA